MDKASMRSKFSERCAHLDSALSDNDRDIFLNAAFRYGIPALVPGHLTEGEWEITTSSGVPDYDYDDEVYEVRRGARIGTYRLSQYFRKAQFEQDYSQTASNAKPYAVLFYGRTAMFYPTPNAIYTVTVPARLYGSTDIPTSGIANHNHAMSVVCEAVREFLVDQDEIEKASGVTGELMSYVGRLRAQSLGRARERRGGISF